MDRRDFLSGLAAGVVDAVIPSAQAATPKPDRDPNFAIGHSTCAIDPNGIATIRNGQGEALAQEQLQKPSLLRRAFPGAASLQSENIEVHTRYNMKKRAHDLTCDFSGAGKKPEVAIPAVTPHDPHTRLAPEYLNTIRTP